MRILKINEVKRKTGKGKSSIYADGKEGLFPAPIKTGKRSSGWIDEEVDDWLKQKVADRDDAAA